MGFMIERPAAADSRLREIKLRPLAYARQQFELHKGVLKRILFICIAVLTVFFFIGGPDHDSPRHFKTAWNLGHILYFAMLALYLSLVWEQQAKSFRYQFMLIMALAIALGGMIELVQGNFGRISDWGDLLRDMIGALAGIFFLMPARKAIRSWILRSMQVTAVILIGWQLFPVMAALTDEYLAARQFPVLAGFETPFELDRWTGSANFSMDHTVHRSGRSSMRVQLKPGRYSGVRLRYFPENWQSAGAFEFSVYNPSDELLTLTCRIHDRKHESGRQTYDDRFNRQFIIARGWHAITIRMDDIVSAPRTRPMDLRHIKSIGIFASHVRRARIFYIDDVRLLPKIPVAE